MSASDDLERRISQALDHPLGLAADESLRNEIEASPEAKRLADEMTRIDAGLRAFVEPTMSDDAWEALATRIEQRLDEALPKIGDPSGPPVFDDADAKREPRAKAPGTGKAAAGYTPPSPSAAKKKASGEFSLENLTKLSVKDEPVVKTGMKPLPARPAATEPGATGAPKPVATKPGAAKLSAPTPVPRGPLQVKPPVATPKPLGPKLEPGTPPPKAPLGAAPADGGQRDSTTEISADDIESIPPPSAPEHAAHAPPPPPPSPSATAKTASGAASKAPGAEAKKEERAKIPSVRPAVSSVVPSFEPLAPPISLDEQRRKRRSAFYIGGVFAAAAVVGLAVVVGVSSKDEVEESLAMAPAEQGLAEEEASLAPAPSPPVTAAPEPAGAAAYAEAPAAEESEIAPGELGDDGREAGSRGASSMPVASALDSTAEGAPAEAMATQPARRRIARGGATTRTEAPPETRTRTTPSMASTGASASGSGPGSPSREDVVAALRAIQPQVSACRAARGGVVEVDITVSGSSGRVRNALVVGEFSGTREGSCVARAVRSARFPTFSRDTFHVRYPFRL